jgi:hypothetical protein
MLRRLLPLWNAAPGLPLFYIHKSKPMPAVHFLAWTWWLIPVAAAMFDMLRRQGKSLQRSGYLAGTIIVCVLLLWPGVSAVITASLDDSSEMHPFRERMHFTLFEQCSRMYVKPVKYARSSFSRLRSKLSSPVTMQTYIRSPGHEGYLGLLHQGAYTFTFNVQSPASPGPVHVSASIFADSGRLLLGRSEAQLSESGKPTPLQVSFSVDQDRAHDCTYSWNAGGENSSLEAESLEAEITLLPLAAP